MTLHVLHIGKYFAPFSGGIENFLLDLIRASHRQGVRSSFLGHAHERRSADAKIVPSNDALHCIERVPVWAHLGYAPISPGFPRAAKHQLQSLSPDLLHIHLPNPSAFWLLASRRARRLPWVVHWHSDVVGPGLDTHLRLLYPAYRPFEQALLRRADWIIATSPNYLDSSPALKPWRDKCRIIPLGLDEQRIQQTAGRPALAWRHAGYLRVLAVGRLTAYKKLDVLIEAIGRTDQTELIILGDGDQRGALEQRLDSGARERIQLLGITDDRLRNSLLASCDLLALPSANRAEAFGLVLLEAMAAGKPVIAGQVAGSGMGWVVEDEQNGWLVEPGQAGPLAERLNQGVRDRARLKTMGRSGRIRFEACFRIETVAARIIELYRSLRSCAPGS